MKKNKALVLFVIGLLFLDRLSKWFILKNPDFYLGRFIELKLFKNSDLYFFSLNLILLNLIIGAVLLLLVFFFFNPHYQRKFGVRARTGLSLIILGGLSNFFDRLYFGYVIDWIRIFILPISIFNIADVMIIGGIICLIFHLIKSK